MKTADRSSPVLKKLGLWARDTVKQVDVAAIHVFGSLVYRSGERFDPASSDVDLVLTLGQKSSTDPVERVASLKSLLQRKEALEVSLQKALQRRGDVPIVSAVVLADWDLAEAIHKDRSPTFFSDTDFLDLLSRTRAPLGKRMSERVAFSDALAAAQGAQKLRHQYLAISAR